MKRLFRLLLVFAMLLAPLTMVGGGGAMAMNHDTGASMAMDHCAGMDQPSPDRPDVNIDCMMTCAAVPPLVPSVEAQAMAPAPIPHSAPATARHGLDPEAETPPPRVS